MRGYLDIHTHKTKPIVHAEQSPVSQLCSLSATNPADAEIIAKIQNEKEVSQSFFTIGWHPWDTVLSPQELETTITNTLNNNLVVGIGEAGLDKLRGAPMEQQEILFRKQAEIAELHALPLIVHCVKTFDRIYALRKEMRPSTPWILHGFRSNPEQMTQWLKLPGTYISFGEHFNEESVRKCPPERFFTETDASQQTIDSVCEKIASARDESVSQLVNQLWNNWDTITPSILQKRLYFIQNEKKK